MAMGNHAHFILKDGTVKAIGLNNYGQLGDATLVNKTNLVTIPISNVKQICSGMYHTLFLMKDGTVKGCGSNEYGQLEGTNTNNVSNLKSLSVTGVKQLACGRYSSFFLMVDGSVYALGQNNYGQLGTGDGLNKSTPYKIAISGVKKIECGAEHTAFLLNNGEVKTVGWNQFGQLANGTTATGVTTTLQSVSLNNIKDVVCSANRTIFLLNDDTALNIGYNANGQLGDGGAVGIFKKILLDGISKIAAGDSHTIFVMNNGKAYTMGYNEQGQLGDGTVLSKSSLVDTGLSNVIKAFCTSYASYFLLADGSLKAVGWNQEGQLLNGRVNLKEPVIQNSIIGQIQSASNMLPEITNRFLFQQVDQLKTWLSGNWKNVTGPLTKELFLAEGVASLAEIPTSMLTNGTKVLKWSDDPAASTLSTTIPKSLYDPTNKLYKGIGVVETAKETLTAKPKTLIVNADHTEALLSFSLDNGVSWYTIGNGEVKNINSLNGLELKVRATLPTTTATITALSYAWA